MPDVSVYYFPIKGLGESIRLLLAYGGQEFEDVRIPKEIWPQRRSIAAFGQVPVLEIDGKRYAQSVAISRYLGRKYGLTGANIEEDFLIDQNVDFVNEIRLAASTVQNEPDPAVKAVKRAKFLRDKCPFYLQKLDEIIRSNNGHLAAGKLTWGDIYFAGLYSYLRYALEIPDLDQKYPSFKKLQDYVLSLPQLKQYLANAPQTDF
ncbi:glutathione S-transferase 2-like [Galleria mellonella]|uniref:glutathione transferase n=1 Tax=Galleria mellonella TaxID=7137 RepID=A0ABM3MUR9_GALME|nr:glutathione S-transferase 2-like [Galleria mellonella]